MKRPVVAAHSVLTVDGKIAGCHGAPTGLSPARETRRALEIRAQSDALLIGRRMLEACNPSMGLPARDLREARVRDRRPAQPLRVVFTRRGDLRRDLKFFRSRGAPIVVFTTAAMPRATRASLERVADVRIAGRAGGDVDLRVAMEVLRSEYKVRMAVCEGGPALLKGLLEGGLLDRIFVTFAPMIFGGAETPTLLGPAASSLLEKSVRLRLEDLEAAGGAAYATYRVLKAR